MSNYTPKTIFPEIESKNEIVFNSKINYLSFISEFSKDVAENLNYYVGVRPFDTK